MSLWSRDFTTWPFSRLSRSLFSALSSGVISADVAASQRLSTGALASSSPPPQPASTPTTSNKATRNGIDSGTSVPYAQRGLERFEKQDDDTEDGRDHREGAHDAHGWPAVDAGLVNSCVALSARKQPAVHRVGRSAGEHERDREAAPEEHVLQLGVQCARNDEHERVVDDLHHGDADRVRGECDRGNRGECEAGAQQREARERVAEHERQRYGED